MTAWERLLEKDILRRRLKIYIEIGLKWAVKYYKRMDGSPAFLEPVEALPRFFDVSGT